MKYDKNSLIGFVLIFFVLIIFNTYFFPKPEMSNSQNVINDKEIATKETDDSNKRKDDKKTLLDSELDSSINQELKYKYGEFAKHTIGKEKIVALENEKIKLLLSSQGGRISSVIVKEGYIPGKTLKTYDQKELKLFDKDSSIFNLEIPLEGRLINTSELFFDIKEYEENRVGMILQVDQNSYIEFLYTLSLDANKGYLIDYDIKLEGLDYLVSRGKRINLQWQMKTPKTEKSAINQNRDTQIFYKEKETGDLEKLSNVKSKNEDLQYGLSWIAFKQQFFSSILINKNQNNFGKGGRLSSINFTDDYLKDTTTNYIKNFSLECDLGYNYQKNQELNFAFYFGPNHYNTLKEYSLIHSDNYQLKNDHDFEDIIPLGYIWFDTLVNKYIVIDLFNFLSKYISNYGLIILLLTLIIKLVLSPLSYKAYLSQAKMKVLKPEIDQITEKYKNKDPMKAQQETMSLYRKAGVNPMGGCLPMLFQFPILIAMFRFFPASFELRQESFLWADDLSSYDSILELGFSIPFYGDHVSLFTLLMTISTILYTRVNTQMATGQMAQMKWIMYLMPILFLGFFNNYASGLTYYYFLANMITYGQQFVMKRMIDEKALLAEIEANKKKPKKKSKFQKKLEELQKKQEQQMKQRKKK